MAGSLEANATLYKKQPYKYVPPVAPSHLTDCSNFTLDLNDRVFLHIGFDPTRNFEQMVHIITSSRYVSITINYLRDIYSILGNIISSLLDPPVKSKEIIFLENDYLKLSKVIYRSQNVIVIEPKKRFGCRLLLNKENILTLMELESYIFEEIQRKTILIEPSVLKQLNDIVTYLYKEHPCETSDDDENILMSIKKYRDQTFNAYYNYTHQLKLMAAKQVKENLKTQRKKDATMFKVV
jgi:hypothetical protein